MVVCMMVHGDMHGGVHDDMHDGVHGGGNAVVM